VAYGILDRSCPPQRAWWMTIYAKKGPPHPLLVLESYIARDDLDWLSPFLHSRKSYLCTQTLYGPCRSVARFFQKQSGELTRADPSDIGHPFDR